VSQKRSGSSLSVSFPARIPLSFSLSFGTSLGSIDSLDKKLWRKWVRQKKKKKRRETIWAALSKLLAKHATVCVCICVYMRGSLLYFIEIDILGSKCIGAEHITFIICCSCLAVSFSSAFFFCSLQSPLPLAPRGILHSQLIRIFVGSKVKSFDITKWVSLVSL